MGLMFPSVIGLVIDYFPPRHSTTAVAIISMGSTLGISMNFEMIAIIGALGWRFSYEALGVFALAVGIS